LTAKELGLSCITLEQDSLGGTVYTFPRPKIVMTNPMHLPLYGKLKLDNTSKKERLVLWKKVVSENELEIKEKTKVEEIIPSENGQFTVKTSLGDVFKAQNVLLAVGRRGTPRKLGIPGELSSKVAYRLLDSERIKNKKILIVGGGDSAIESALLLKDFNEVILSYRKDKFSRLKPGNRHKILDSIEKNQVDVVYNSNLISIKDSFIDLQSESTQERIENDLVYIFAGGELPNKFLNRAGIEITKRFGYILKQH
jgi:thioredoxin reductase